jgi:ABC-type nitrate/sulfonate/bicarbonate transport system ATPase subunit
MTIDEREIIPHEYEIGPPILRVENVSHAYGEKLVLRDVNFEIPNIMRRKDGIEQGQVWSFLGLSGAGKTTLANIIAGLIQPTAGQVLIQPENRSVRPGEVGFVFQNYIAFPHLTVHQNLLVAAYQGLWREHANIRNLKDLPQRLYSWIFAKKVFKEQVEQYLDMVQLREHLDKYPYELSGGQKQRMAVLMQVLCSSRYIVLDEPFSGQDPVRKQKTCEMLIKVSQLNELQTLFVITHDIDPALWVSDTLLVIGREKDPDTQEWKPGNTVFRPVSLAERGLAWQDFSICTSRAFTELSHEIKYEWFPKM